MNLRQVTVNCRWWKKTNVKPVSIRTISKGAPSNTLRLLENFSPKGISRAQSISSNAWNDTSTKCNLCDSSSPFDAGGWPGIPNASRCYAHKITRGVLVAKKMISLQEKSHPDAFWMRSRVSSSLVLMSLRILRRIGIVERAAMKKKIQMIANEGE